VDPEIWQPIVALAATAGVFFALQWHRGAATDFVFLCGLAVVTLAGVISPEQALAGFANPAILTIGGLLAVAAGLRITGVLDWVGRRLLGRAESERGAMLRLIPTVAAASAFLLNTAVVAMMMPVVLDWCRRRSISPSRLLMPVSYLAILGGVCTTMGTSTTLVVQGKLAELQQRYGNNNSFADDLQRLSLFEIGAVGLPCAILCGATLVLWGRRLLPNRVDLIEQFGEKRREYLVQMLVQPQCRLIGQSVESAGLRHLPGLFLIEIDRQGEVITPVTPLDTIRAGDHLVFTGVVSTIVDLQKTPGLVPAADVNYETHPSAGRKRHLTEVVLSRTSPLIGQTIREGQFRQRYNAAVIAVHRNGVRLTNKVGDIQLEPGDTLLLQTRTEFVSSYRNHRDFYLVSSVDGVEPRQHNRAVVAACLAGLLVVWLVAASLWSSGLLGGLSMPAPSGLDHVDARANFDLVSVFTSPAIAALTIVLLMIASRCLTASEARGSLDLSMLLTIGAALGLGRAITESGAADLIANTLVASVGGQPLLLLAVVFLLAVALTETITNNAVAAMLLPLAVAVAWTAGLSPRPFIVAITLAASLSFLTPVGYQTNLMVMGPGGYQPSDYLRCGAPLTLLTFATAMTLIPLIWPF
jgi:di/tricarboxylate transporter